MPGKTKAAPDIATAVASIIEKFKGLPLDAQLNALAYSWGSLPDMVSKGFLGQYDEVGNSIRAQTKDEAAFIQFKQQLQAEMIKNIAPDPTGKTATAGFVKAYNDILSRPGSYNTQKPLITALIATHKVQEQKIKNGNIFDAFEKLSSENQLHFLLYIWGGKFEAPKEIKPLIVSFETTKQEWIGGRDSADYDARLCQFNDNMQKTLINHVNVTGLNSMIADFRSGYNQALQGEPSISYDALKTKMQRFIREKLQYAYSAPSPASGRPRP